MNVAIVWEDEAMGLNLLKFDIPADMADKAAEYREAMLIWLLS